MNKQTIFGKRRLVLILGLALLMLAASVTLALAQAASPAPVGIIDAGDRHTCALLPSGAVDCWGENDFGQLSGTPDSTVRFSTQPGPYTQVSAGGYHTCALTPSGAVDCWGENSSGQSVDQPGPYTQVSVGGIHSCALTPSGAVDCWGHNYYGQVSGTPDGTIQFSTHPGPYAQVSVGGVYTCALTLSGEVDCWGQNGSLQATDQPGPYTQVSAGGAHICALTSSGSVDCWGLNNYGQAVAQPGPYTQVSAGQFHTCALAPSGAVDCWGRNNSDEATDRPGPYTLVNAGLMYHTCALTTSGAVDCWGENDYGQVSGTPDEAINFGTQPGPYGAYLPDTTIDSAPADPSYGGVTFAFSSDLTGAAFECQMDLGGWSSCTSPKTYLVLAAGQHSFEVRAVNASGGSDLTPASATWTVASVPLAPVGIVDAGLRNTCALAPSGVTDCWGSNLYGQATDQPGPYTQVSAGTNYTCALTPSGAINCWGDNHYGQVSGTPDDTIHFGTQPGPYIQVSAGQFHTCALMPSGAVDCWGLNSPSQATDQSGSYTQVSAGMFHTCALTSSGAAYCWGNDTQGEATEQPGPYTQVSAGYRYTCALTPSGAVDCWGDNGYGQLTGTPDQNMHFGTQPGPYISVSAGFRYACALTSSGAVDCWGDNSQGGASDQLGPYIQVSASYSHTCALTTSGAVDCWGYNEYGQVSGTPDETINFGTLLGPYGAYLPDTTIISAPVDPSYGGVTFAFTSDLAGATFECQMDLGGWSSCTSPKTYLVLAAGQHTFDVRAVNVSGGSDLTPASAAWTVASVPPAPLGIVDAGEAVTCALMPSGAVDCWGDNHYRQVSDTPDDTIHFSTHVSAGGHHTCALTPSGAVDCWGENGDGQATDHSGPYTRVSAGFLHTCALTPSGAVDCWGANFSLQADDHPGPYTQTSAGANHTCALKASGAVDCWGWNDYGQVSGTPNGSIYISTQPGPYTQISAGYMHTCALTPSGTVDCWGWNAYGQATDQPGPYTRVSAGGYHTCALTPSGAVDCWGANNSGQSTDQSGPYTQVSAGGYHTCALTPSGTVDCWGENLYAQAADQPGPYEPYVRPLPGLSILSPSSAAAGSGDLTLTVTGSDFVLGSLVRWNGTALATTFVSTSELSALLPSGSLTGVQTAQITVFTPAPGGGTSSVLAFFITQASANVTGQQVASGTNPDAAAGPATAAATGEGLLAVAQYDANPGGTPGFLASGSYFDVYAAPGNTFSQVNIVACGVSPNDKLYWWDSGTGKWAKADPQTYDSTTGCVTLVVDASSSPSLSQLQGTFFAAGVALNTPPTANPGGPYMAAINTAIAFDGSFSSDADDDPLTYAWTFGDGGTGAEAQPSHSYTATGVFDVCLTVNDGIVDSQVVCTLVAVYDPGAGFVTGGGWIDSPAGAYLPDPTLTGKATFGFVSKYLKGTTIPTGNTEFQFQAGSFNFHSTAYEWLVVNQKGTNAQFKGSGLINGAGDPNGNEYKFMLWAGDGSPDTFRIMIWWEVDDVENIVYDNGFDQATGGGSIVVHTGN